MPQQGQGAARRRARGPAHDRRAPSGGVPVDGGRCRRPGVVRVERPGRRDRTSRASSARTSPPRRPRRALLEPTGKVGGPRCAFLRGRRRRSCSTPTAGRRRGASPGCRRFLLRTKADRSSPSTTLHLRAGLRRRAAAPRPAPSSAWPRRRCADLLGADPAAEVDALGRRPRARRARAPAHPRRRAGVGRRDRRPTPSRPRPGAG